MEWLGTILTGLALLVLLAPLLSLLVTVFVLVPLAHLLPHPALVARASFTCPFSTRRGGRAAAGRPGAPRRPCGAPPNRRHAARPPSARAPASPASSSARPRSFRARSTK